MNSYMPYFINLWHLKHLPSTKPSSWTQVEIIAERTFGTRLPIPASYRGKRPGQDLTIIENLFGGCDHAELV